MTALPIHRSAKPMLWRGPIEPMADHERNAWAETRVRHPQYYRDERK